MSSSKFANLEGVDFESPDVYETHSPSPETRTRRLGRSNRGRGSTSSSEDSDDDENGHSDSGESSGRRGTKKVGGQEGLQGAENPDIVATALDPDEAAKRFQSASGVDGRSVDFSSAIQKRKKRPQYYPTPPTFETTTYALGSGIGYQTSGGGLGPGDEEPWTKVSQMKEKPLDRYRRLRFEVEELEKELEAQAGGNETVPSSKQDAKDIREDTPPGLMFQVSGLKGQLASIDERNLNGKATSTTWNIETRRLLDRLSLQGVTSEGGVVEEGAGRSLEGQGNASNGGGSAKMAELDKRLAELEQLVGVRDAFIDETKTLPLPLLPSLARIEHLLTLLTHPRHLDGISRRIKVLVSELERLHEARRKLANVGHQHQQIEDRKIVNGDATSLSTSSQMVTIPIETMQKLDTVLPTLSKLDPLIPLVPALLARLNSLAALHASSNSFVEDMNTLESTTKRSTLSTDELKSILSNLEASFSENASRVESNFKVVEARMESITQRVEKLSQ